MADGPNQPFTISGWDGGGADDAIAAKGCDGANFAVSPTLGARVTAEGGGLVTVSEGYYSRCERLYRRPELRRGA
jgi:hypothetical protein